MTENLPRGRAGEARIRNQAEGDGQPGVVAHEDEGSGQRAGQDPVGAAPESGPA